MCTTSKEKIYQGIVRLGIVAEIGRKRWPILAVEDQGSGEKPWRLD